MTDKYLGYTFSNCSVTTPNATGYILSKAYRLGYEVTLSEAKRLVKLAGKRHYNFYSSTLIKDDSFTDGFEQILSQLNPKSSLYSDYKRAIESLDIVFEINRNRLTFVA